VSPNRIQNAVVLIVLSLGGVVVPSRMSASEQFTRISTAEASERRLSAVSPAPEASGSHSVWTARAADSAQSFTEMVIAYAPEPAAKASSRGFPITLSGLPPEDSPGAKVPEPASFFLFVSGLFGMRGASRRVQKLRR